MKRLRRFLAITSAIACAAAFVFLPNNAAVVNAEAWTHPGGGWHYLPGTDIKVEIKGNAVYIHGTGALPDFDFYKLHERPWNGTKVETVSIDQSITYIGKYAFYNMQDLKYISMYKSTFIKDITCFDKIAYKPIYRIFEAPVSTEMIGTIPFTSLDSILAVAQTNYNGASYILDTVEKAREFQNSTNPTVSNVYHVDQRVSEANAEVEYPWLQIENYHNGNVATPICKLSPLTPNNSYNVSAQRRYPGRACYDVYAAFIGDYTYAAPFNVIVMKKVNGDGKAEDKKVEDTKTPYTYILTIPEEFRQPLRQFRLIGIGTGEVYFYDDEDTDDSTITFTTQKPSTAYALVYK